MATNHTGLLVARRLAVGSEPHGLVLARRVAEGREREDRGVLIRVGRMVGRRGGITRARRRGCEVVGATATAAGELNVELA